MTQLRRFTALILALAIVFAFLSTGALAAENQPDNHIQVADRYQPTGQTQSTDRNEYLDSVRALIKEKYSGDIPEEALNKATNLKDMFGLLDDYSGFLTPEEFNSFIASLSGSVEGIGVLANHEEKSKYIIIDRVYKNSPAWKAGVLPGDRIAEINDEPVVGKPFDEAMDMVKGAAGTKVKLGLLRQGEKNTITLEITREKIDIPTVHYEIRGNIGYLQINTFSANTSSGVATALEYFDSKKITRVIMDLRNNPGGYFDEAVEVARYLVPKGVITKLDYKDETEPDQTFYSSRIKLKYKLAVLVNENSASSSEILTGAIKDSKAGIIVGTKTFGKAKVQSFFPLFNEEAFKTFNYNNEIKKVNAFDFTYYPMDNEIVGWAKMTVGLYYTPNGQCIDLNGIEPNVKVAEDATVIPVSLLEPLTETVKPKLGTTYLDVFYAEAILKHLNYNVDPPDRVLDKKTVAAIAEFQKNNKLYSYGVLDFSTQRLLNYKLAEMKQSKDPVYIMAAKLIK